MACHRSSHHQPCCCCCCCASSCCQSSPHPATATAAVNDPLLQAIAAHLIQSPAAAPQPAYHLYNQEYAEPQRHYTCNQEYPKPEQHYPQQQQRRRQQQEPKYHYQQQHQPQPKAQSIIETLLGRIAALETALPHLSTAPPPPAARPKPPPRKSLPSHPVPPTTPRGSIRDLAARTIQAHFRQYLVWRSQALRHLRHLAAVRSHVAAIKSSLSDEAHLNPKALSQRATDLLLQLDSIQGTDPMIREGKRSISRELVQLLDFADGISAKRHELFMESMEIASKGIDPAASAEKSAPGVEELAEFSTVFGEEDEESDAERPKARAFTAKTAKRVSFADDGRESRVSAAAGLAPLAEEELTGVSEDDRRPPIVDELVGGFRRSSDDDKSPMGGQKAVVARPPPNGLPSGSRTLGLSAPLPAQMEPRREGDSKRKNNVVVV